MSLVCLFVALLFGHSLVSKRLERTVLTPPICFTLAGGLALFLLPEYRDMQASPGIFLRVAEIGLVLLLFTDASRTDLRVLKRIGNLPARLLSVGMLLTILLGAVIAKVVFPGFTIWEAGILAAILAPTDAGLGQVIVNSPRVPLKIRQALNVEAGLNDGLSVPFLLFFIALAATSSLSQHASLSRLVIEQLGYGVMIGGAIGLVGGWLLGFAQRRAWIATGSLQLGVVALPLLCGLASEPVGASMFIASFVAGLAVQAGFQQAGQHSVEFTEEWGQLFNLSVFFLFGLRTAREAPYFTWLHALYAILSLTIVRMVPVAVALWGTGFSRATVLFMGWFGPRGLASIVLGLVYLERESQATATPVLRLVVMLTVLMSILAHGLSAKPGMEIYARKVKPLPPEAPEFEATAAGSDNAVATIAPTDQLDKGAG